MKIFIISGMTCMTRTELSEPRFPINPPNCDCLATGEMTVVWNDLVYD